MLRKNAILSLFAISLLTLSAYSYAAPFTIVPVGTLPTTVPEGGSVTAAYTVTSGMRVQRDGNFVKSLPNNVTVSGTGCGTTFNLAAGASCTLNLTISGAANGVTNPLYVCASDGITCSGTASPLNVTVGGGTTVAQYPMLIPFSSINMPDVNAGPYAIDSSNGPLPADFVSNGFFNDASCGSSSCIAVGKYTASSSVVYPMIAKGDTDGQNWTYVVDKTTGTLPPSYGSAGNFDTVSCSGTTCVVGGTYVDSTTGGKYLILGVSNDSGATWTYPISNDNSTWPSTFVNLPNNVANFTSVDCADSSYCVAAGTYNGSTGTIKQYPVVARTANSGATWTYVIQQGAGLPGDFSTAGAFNSIDCTGSGTTAVCAVGGTYETTSNTFYPLLSSSANSGSSWTQRINSSIQGPSNASGVLGTIYSVACTGLTSTAICAAGGTYSGSANVVFPFIATSTNASSASSTWTYSISGDFPPTSITNGGAINGVSCTGATTTAICAAAGFYQTAGGQVPYLVSTTDGWFGYSTSVDAGTNLPPDLSGNVAFNSASCNTSTGCLASGSYTAGGVVYPLTITSQDGASWSYIVYDNPSSLPPDFASNGALPTSLCNSSFCLAAGYYTNNGTSRENSELLWWERSKELFWD